MKRFHVHLSVPDLEQSIRFYSSLFGAQPAARKPDYAKWMLEDPRVNFAISSRASGARGLNHLGFQVESADELASVRKGFAASDAARVVDEPGAHCCYARSDKHWVTDPQGIAWEAFHTLETVPLYDAAEAAPSKGACGVPALAGERACCAPSQNAGAAPTACCN